MARPKGRTIITKPCEHCGKSVSRRKGQERPHTFCSLDCYWKSDYRSTSASETNSRPDAWRPVTCDGCGKKFQRYASHINKRNFCSRDCQTAHRQKGSRFPNGAGYMLVFVGRGTPGAAKSGYMLEHRHVMQQHLGRPLLPSESVHHLNGVRNDNRLENLELWSSSHPCGQRVADKVRWAREFLAFYENQENENG